MLAVTGGTTDPTQETPLRRKLFRVVRGRVTQLADLAAFEAAVNPDGGIVESNPFDVAALWDGSALVADAAANALLVVDHEGELHLDDVRALLDAVKDEPLLAPWVRLGIDCAARPGELAALTWADLDLKATPATVTITKAIVWEPDEHGRTVARLTAGKTATEDHPHRGHRRVTISPSTVAALKAHLDKKGFGDIEVCLIDQQNNCSGGGGTGVTIGQTYGPLTMTLNFADLGAELLMDNFGVRFQSIDAPSLGIRGGSGTGSETPPEFDTPEPATLVLLGLGLLGAGLVRQRRT